MLKEYPSSVIKFKFRSLFQALYLYMHTTHICLGFVVTEEELREVASFSRILNTTDTDYIDAEVRQMCEEIINNPSETSAKDYVKTYLLLKYRE